MNNLFEFWNRFVGVFEGFTDLKYAHWA